MMSSSSAPVRVLLVPLPLMTLMAIKLSDAKMGNNALSGVDLNQRRGIWHVGRHFLALPAAVRRALASRVTPQ
jgi:hypothetical protein